MKKCTVCKESKPYTEYHRLKISSDGFGYRCKPCDTLARAAYRERNKDRRRRLDQEQNWASRFSLTREGYEAMLANQGGRCAICGTTNPCGEGSTATHLQHLAVDHCHTTGKIRGLLCNPCNRGIGMLKDDPALLEKAATYLKECH